MENTRAGGNLELPFGSDMSRWLQTHTRNTTSFSLDFLVFPRSIASVCSGPLTAFTRWPSWSAL
jgi:hypothetical protein